MSPPIEPHLWVTDVPRSIAWYDHLGFEVVATFPDAVNPTWVQIRRGAAAVMLAAVPANAEGYVGDVPARLSGDGGAISLYLHVDDVDHLHDTARAAGLAIIEPLRDAWWGGRQFTLSDPDGHWWTIFKATEG